jgi:hypothetical protein
VEGAKIGDTLRLRDPVMFTAADGPAMTPQNVVETQKNLVLNRQKVVGFAFTSKDLTVSIDNFAARYLDSAAVALANAGYRRADHGHQTCRQYRSSWARRWLDPFWSAGGCDSNSAPMTASAAW